jgi:hypothetical protein
MTEQTIGPGRRSRITRQMMLDAFRLHGQMTRSDLQEHFNILNVTTMQMHITSLREDARVFIADWREPKKTGMWSPVYALRSDANEQDVPHPPPRNRWRDPVLEPVEDAGEFVVLRGEGVKAEHAHMARVRGETMGLGQWGGLLAPWRR